MKCFRVHYINCLHLHIGGIWNLLHIGDSISHVRIIRALEEKQKSHEAEAGR